MKTYRVIVAQTESAARKQLLDALRKQARLIVVGVTEDGLQVLRMVRASKPDLVIVDAVLGGLDGLGVLSQLNTQEFSHVQRLFLSDFSGFVQSQAAQLGADLFIQTPAAFARIARLALGLVEEASFRPAEPTDEDVRQETRRVLSELLPQYRSNRIAITDVSNGVLLLLRGKCGTRYATGNLYPAIGACRGAAWKAVERSIRVLVNDIWTNAPLAVLERTFPRYFQKSVSTRPKPTTLSFLIDLTHLVMGRFHGQWKDREEFDQTQMN